MVDVVVPVVEAVAEDVEEGAWLEPAETQLESQTLRPRCCSAGEVEPHLLLGKRVRRRLGILRSLLSLHDRPESVDVG